jgi:hypothetical protein
MPKIMTGDELKKMVADSLARRSAKFTSDVNAGLQSGAGGQLSPINFEENFTNLNTPPNRTVEGLGQMSSSYGTQIAADRTVVPPPDIPKPDVDISQREPGTGLVTPPPPIGSRDTIRGGPPGGGVRPGPSRVNEIMATRARIKRTQGI